MCGPRISCISWNLLKIPYPRSTESESASYCIFCGYERLKRTSLWDISRGEIAKAQRFSQVNVPILIATSKVPLALTLLPAMALSGFKIVWHGECENCVIFLIIGTSYKCNWCLHINLLLGLLVNEVELQLAINVLFIYLFAFYRSLIDFKVFFIYSVYYSFVG